MGDSRLALYLHKRAIDVQKRKEKGFTKHSGVEESRKLRVKEGLGHWRM